MHAISLNLVCGRGGVSCVPVRDYLRVSSRQHGEPALLVEVRICVDRDLKLIGCPPQDAANALRPDRLSDTAELTWTAPCPTTFVFPL